MKLLQRGVCVLFLFSCPFVANAAKSRGEISPTGLVAILVVGGIIAAVVWGSKYSSQKQEEERERMRRQSEMARRERVYAKYGHTEDAKRIISRKVWVGETAEQLRDSLGTPEDIDEKVLKTKRKEIWKYDRKGVNRFGLKFTVENGVVVGWDEKQ